jgi:hypothetical protein
MKNRMTCCVLVSAMTVALACSKSDTSSNTTSATPESSSGTPASAPRPNAVRGQLVSVSDSVLVVASRGGDVRVEIPQPLEVYSRVPASISDVKSSSFVGVTSVPQSDGTLRATEIHIFPEKLRGTGEGSFLMGQGGGGGGAGAGAGNRMTNGTVSGSRMTNGTVAAGSGNRMTNGTVGAQSGNAITVRFQSDSQTIAIPPNVTVTAIALSQTKLTPGMNVVIQTTKAPDGTLKASRVMLSPARPSSR